MKSKEISVASIHVNKEVQASINKRDKELKNMAVNNAKHFAERNLPTPKNDTLSHYVGDIKTAYEKEATTVLLHLQPNANLPEAKIDADFYKDKDANLVSTINDLERRNQNDAYELGNFNPESVLSRIRWAVIATFIISIGEILFNTKAFQVIGESLLFAFAMAVSISLGVLIFSHLIPFLYKGAKTKLQRQLILCGSILLIVGLFTALAILRSQYLAAHDVYIKPIYFVIINIFFFIVSSLLSFFVLPTWHELREHAHQLTMYLAIKKRKKEIVRLNGEREKIKEVILERTKERLRILHAANYYAEHLRKMCHESIETFKRTNLAFRTDRKTPDCFHEEIQPDINDASFNLLLLNRKSS